MKSVFFSLCLIPALYAAPEKVTLSVPTMTCVGCVSIVGGVLKQQAGVTNPFVSLEMKEASFDCDKAQGCDVQKIVEALEKRKYQAKLR